MNRWMTGALGASLALASLAGAAAAANMPMRRGGLWESKMTGGPMNAMAMTIRSCADPARERGDSAFSTGHRPPGCGAQPSITPAPGGGWAYHMICKLNADLTMDVRGVASGDFQSGYVVRTTTRMTPAPSPALAETSMTVTAKWLGACPAGMKPGDTTVNGRPMPRASH